MRAPVDLAAERTARREEYDGMKCECGDAWFRTAVVFGPDGHVMGFSSDDVTCCTCGAKAWWL